MFVYIMADIKVQIFKGNENFRNITQKVPSDCKKISNFAKVLRTVQISTNDALQQLVEAAKGDSVLIDSENEEDEDSGDEHKVNKRKKEEPVQQKGTRKKIKGS